MLRQIPEWGTLSEWNEVNRTLNFLLNRYRKDMLRAVQVAHDIADALNAVFPVQDFLCSETCTHCPEPCCLNATVWLDFKDLLFFHLTGQYIPEKQLIEKTGDVCRYSSPTGCLLPRLSRPWTCTYYLCPPQKLKLRRFPEDLIRDFEEKTDLIKQKRKMLEKIFMQLIT